ncbi:MAG: ribosome maturation factor RimM [Negativicutes bacterium]|nr:ribosome maturation factor RimM [Negativicutes bacterium]
MQRELFTIGKIVAPHGVRGDVRVVPLSDFPERFQALKKVYFDDGLMLDVEGVKFHKQFVLLKFRGYDSMNDAEKLRNRLIKVPREDLVKLPEGHYFHFDIIGLEVYTTAGEFLGKVTDILVTGSNDVYVAEKDGAKPVLIPALKKVVKTIDLAAGRMTVELLEEWE